MLTGAVVPGHMSTRTSVFAHIIAELAAMGPVAKASGLFLVWAA